MEALIPCVVAQMVLPKLELMGFKTGSYTSWNVILLVWAIISEAKGLIPYLYCSTMGVNISFHVAILMDRTAFVRFAKDLGVSNVVFRIVDVVIHLGSPLVAHRVLEENGMELLWYHGLIASLFNISWGWRMCGDWKLDKVYIEMRPECWFVMWVVVILVEIALPFMEYMRSEIFMYGHISVMGLWIYNDYKWIK